MFKLSAITKDIISLKINHSMSIISRSDLQKKLYRLGLKVTDVNATYHQWKILLEAWDKEETKPTFTEHQMFWSMVETALREKWTLGIQKIFDESGNIENIERIIKDCNFNKGLFKIESIREWMKNSNIPESMITQQLANCVDPTIQEFDELHNSVTSICPTARKIIKDIRNNWLSHENSEWDMDDVASHYRTLLRGDVEKILLRCWEAHHALSGALTRGDSLRIEDLPEFSRKLPEPWPMKFLTNQILTRASNLPQG